MQEQDLPSRFTRWPTPLQKHIAFFDRNNDGYVSPLETWQGFRALGFNFFLTFLAVAFIHITGALPTSDTIIPTSWSINIKNAHRMRHGGSTEVYDEDGNVDEEKFEKLWKKYDPENKGFLDKSDIAKMIWSKRLVYDFFGTFSAIAEWTLLYTLVALYGQKRGVEREDLVGLHDGSLFYRTEEHLRRKHIDEREATYGKGSQQVVLEKEKPSEQLGAKGKAVRRRETAKNREQTSA